MKIIISFEEFKNSPLHVGQEFIKAGFGLVHDNEHKLFEVILNDSKDLLEFYKILVNN